MKINGTQLRKIILQEMHDMRRDEEERDHGHGELLSVVMDAAGGCPVKARGMLQGMIQQLGPEAEATEDSLQYDDEPNPATSGIIPQDMELELGDRAYMEQKKPTGVRGPGGTIGIFGPGFR
jgi:hypothetical protein